MRKKAIILIAEGFEEIEAISCIDILRRGGIEVLVSGINSLQIKGSRGITVVADKLLKDSGIDFDACIIPGGSQGAENLAKSKEVKDFILTINAQGKIIAAICAAPAAVLTPTGILKGKHVTGYPGKEEEFDKDTIYSQEKVVVDSNIITSQGPATAIEFALTILTKLTGEEIALKVRKAILAI